MNNLEIIEKLQAPFKPEEIEWRVGSTNADKTKGLALAYVTNRAIQQRLDDVFGIFGWKNEFKEWKDKSQICGISVKYGDEWITKWDGSDDSNMDATKGGLSDAMKRSAYQWGIGRYLYKLPATWVKIKSYGKSYALDETPKLPSWAVPKNTNTPAPTPQKETVIDAKQLQNLWQMAGAAEKSEEQIHTWIKLKLNKESTKQLNQSEYKELTLALTKIINEKTVVAATA